MKNLVLVVNAGLHQAVTDALRTLEVKVFTVAHVEGHGTQPASEERLSARDRVVGFVPRVRIDILLADKEVDKVVSALSAPGAALSGHGTYWVSPVERDGAF